MQRTESTKIRATEFAQPAPDLLTPAEVARRLRLEEGTLANWRTSPKKRALLPYVKLGGGAIRYRAAVVDAFIAGSVVAA